MSKKKHKGSKNYNYINELQEWQEHQYDPGYYTEGRMPPALKNEGNSPLIGWCMLYSGIGGALIILLILWKLIGFDQLLKGIAASFLYIFLVAITLIGAVRTLKKAYANKPKAWEKAKRKNIKAIVIILCFIAVVEIGANVLGQVQETMVATPTGNVVPSSSNDKYYLQIKDRNMDILCSKKQNEEFWKFRTYETHPNYNYVITFKWNKLDPQHGRLIKMERKY